MKELEASQLTSYGCPCTDPRAGLRFEAEPATRADTVVEGDTVRIGVPTEVKNREYRVALTPIGVHELVTHGHEVMVQKGAGLGSQVPDEEYVAAGAQILDTRRRLCGRGRGPSLKVKEPVAEEYHRPARGADPLHLPAPGRGPPTSPASCSTRGHRDRLRDGAAALGRAAAALPDVRGRRLPRPPGRRLPADEGPGWPRRPHGRVGGVANAKVVIIGAGVSGQNAANIALGMGADVTLLDTDLDKLRMSFWRYDNRVHGLASSSLAIRQQVMEADMVIGAVLIPARPRRSWSATSSSRR